MTLNYGTENDYALVVSRLGMGGPAGDIWLAALEDVEAWVDSAFTRLTDENTAPTPEEIKFRLAAGILSAGKHGHVGYNFALYLKLRD